MRKAAEKRMKTEHIKAAVAAAVTAMAERKIIYIMRMDGGTLACYRASKKAKEKFFRKSLYVCVCM